MNIFSSIIRRNAFNLLKNVYSYQKVISFKTKYTPKQILSSTLICSATFLTWFGFKEDEPESELIMTLKRSILCMQRKEYVKAEQMLHLALRLAQEQQNGDGITYAYDLMANLALERHQLDKSEKLFINVLQRLLSTGTPQDDLKVVHISLKLARISQMKNDLEKAEIGYKWCLETVGQNESSKELRGAILDWYSNLLLTKGDYIQSLRHLEEAYQIHRQFNKTTNEKTILLLNDLATLSYKCDRLDVAINYLEEALKLGKEVEDFEDMGIIYANYGIIKMKLGMVNEAKVHCKEAWRLGTKLNSKDTIEQANYCFQQINDIKIFYLFYLKKYIFPHLAVRLLFNSFIMLYKNDTCAFRLKWNV